jgi:hypothetical protein
MNVEHQLDDSDTSIQMMKQEGDVRIPAAVTI